MQTNVKLKTKGFLYVIFCLLLFQSCEKDTTDQSKLDSNEELNEVFTDYQVLTINTSDLFEQIENSSKSNVRLELFELKEGRKIVTQLTEKQIPRDKPIEVFFDDVKQENIPKVYNLHGTVENASKQVSKAVITLAKEYIGGRFEYDEDTYYIEKYVIYNKEADPDQYIVYGQEDLVPQESVCGISESQDQTADENNDEIVETRNWCKKPTVYSVSNYEFTWQSGGYWNAFYRMNDYVNLASSNYWLYSYDLKIDMYQSSYLILNNYVHDFDASPLSISGVCTGFVNYIFYNYYWSRRSVNLLFMGKGYGNIVGNAWSSTACSNPDWAAALISAPWYRSTAHITNTVAHETGHVLGHSGHVSDPNDIMYYQGGYQSAFFGSAHAIRDHTNIHNCYHGGWCD